jgi:hypothetical protein
MGNTSIGNFLKPPAPLKGTVRARIFSEKVRGLFDC